MLQVNRNCGLCGEELNDGSSLYIKLNSTITHQSLQLASALKGKDLPQKTEREAGNDTLELTMFQKSENLVCSLLCSLSRLAVQASCTG